LRANLRARGAASIAIDATVSQTNNRGALALGGRRA